MECTKDKMIVTLEYAPIVKIDLDKVTLKDDDCQLSEYGSLNNTHLMMNTPLDSCKTNYTAEGDTITYQNSLIVKSRDEGGEEISREFTTEFIFTCSYPGSALVSVVNFSPSEKVIYTKTGKELEIVFNTLLIEEVNLKWLCHDDIAVFGQFCVKIITENAGSCRVMKWISNKLHQRAQTIL